MFLPSHQKNPNNNSKLQEFQLDSMAYLKPTLPKSSQNAVQNVTHVKLTVLLPYLQQHYPIKIVITVDV